MNIRLFLRDSYTRLIEKTLSDTSRAYDEIKAENEQLRKENEALREEVAGIDEAIQHLRRRVNPMHAAEMEDAHKRIKELEATIDGLGLDCRDLRAQLDAVVQP